MNISFRLSISLIILNVFIPLTTLFAQTLEPTERISKETFPDRVKIFRSGRSAIDYINNLRLKALEDSDEEIESTLTTLGNALNNYQQHYNLNQEEKTSVLKESLDSYIRAARLSLGDGRIRYSWQIADLASQIGDKQLLDDVFEELLQSQSDEKGLYVALIDYADGLSKFRDEAAKDYFEQAVNMRTPVDGIEAYYRYAKYLQAIDEPELALNILEYFSNEERRQFVHIALLRQQLIHSLGFDTTEVDQEMAEIRETLGGRVGLGGIPKITAAAIQEPKNLLNLNQAYAFSHILNDDDSRGTFANLWMVGAGGLLYARWVVNAGEVLWNEARGEGSTGRYAVAWAIRNRAMINMNGCDHYPGSESDNNVLTSCRLPTPSGPQPEFTDLAKRYSCVVHGDTPVVGGVHSQMDDSHVSFSAVDSSGLMWWFLYTVWGFVVDPTAGSYWPGFYVYYGGNPVGAQEWRSENYCAANNTCKVRLGNVGGDDPDPGNLCPGSGPGNNDNFFWGRKP